MLTAELKAQGRPFGELVPGGNAAPAGQIEQQIGQVKKLVIEGKTVIVPDDEAPEKKTPALSPKKAKRKAKAKS